jgi:hypothetical protein
LRDLPQQKIPRELCGGGDPPIFLGFYVPMESFLMGWIRKLQKHKERDRPGKKFKQEGKNGGKKKKRLKKKKNVCGGSHTCLFSIS